MSLLFILYNVIVLIIGLVKKKRDLVIVGSIGLVLTILYTVFVIVGFAFSDM